MHEIVRRELWRQRIVLMAAVLVGAATGVIFVSSLQPDGSAKVTSGPAFVLLVVVVVCVGYGAVVLLAPPSRAGLRLAAAERAYYAPPRWTVSYEVASICLLTAAVFVVSTRPDRGLLWGILVAVTFLAVIVQLRTISNSVDLIEITSEGIGYGRPRQRFFIPWTALDAATPVRVGASGRGLRLPVSDDPAARTRLSLINVAVAPAVLAEVVAHYANHPEGRAQIGTEAEYARLSARLAGPAQGSPPQPG